MAEDNFLVNFVKRNSLPPMNYYDDPSFGSQIFIPKASRPSLEPGLDINLPLSRNVTCHSPKSMTWSDDLIQKKRVRASDLPVIPRSGFLPTYDRADNFSQLWVNPTNFSTDNAVVDIGVIINQNNGVEDVLTPLCFRPYSSFSEYTSQKSQTTIQNMFLGPPHSYFNKSKRSELKIVNSLKNLNEQALETNSSDFQSNLELVILKIFYREQINEIDLKLSYKDFSILNAILQRKFLKAVDLEPLKHNKENLIKVIENLTSFSSNKRPEECHKFVLSKAFKYLKKVFKPSTGIESDDMSEFYEFYFKDTAIHQKIKISDFYFPSKSKSIKNPNSFNNEYFTKLFSSKRFVIALREYMATFIFQEHKEEIRKKVEKIIEKWNRTFELSDMPADKLITVIKNEIVKNKKFKLPWTFSELYEAIFRVNELIESCV